jgi:peptidoglycan/xylan/chitin deacetylase (PgdA/CDA1 family)
MPLFRPTLLVLIYHNLFPDGLRDGWIAPAAGYMTTASHFQRDVETLLADRRLAPTTPHEFFRGPGGEAERLSVFITFDDGYASSVAALEGLARRGVPGAVFVNSAFVGTQERSWPEKLLLFFHWLGDAVFEAAVSGRSWTLAKAEPMDRRVTVFTQLRNHLKTIPTIERERFISLLYGRYGFALGELPFHPFRDSIRLAAWPDLERLARAGVSIGGHTCTHPILTQCDGQRVLTEIQDDKAALEQRLGRSIDLFAVPNGAEWDYDSPVLDVCRASGYRYVFGVSGKVNNHQEQPFLLYRHDVGGLRFDLAGLIDRVASEATWVSA